jgi:hypothetical protein
LNSFNTSSWRIKDLPPLNKIKVNAPGSRASGLDDPKGGHQVIRAHREIRADRRLQHPIHVKPRIG